MPINSIFYSVTSKANRCGISLLSAKRKTARGGFSSFGLGFDVFKSLSELIRARCASPVAIDAAEELDQFIDRAIFAKDGDALGVAVASPIELHFLDDIPFIGDRHRTGTGSLIAMDVGCHAQLVMAAMAFFATAAAAVFAAIIDFEDLAIDFAGAVAGVGFIGVDMHRKGEIRIDADDDVAEDGLSFRGLDADVDDFIVLDVEERGIGWSHMNMTLGDDDAFFEFDFTAVLWVDDFASATALDIARLADRGFDAKGAGIGRGDLNLVFFPKRSKDGDAGDDAWLAGLWVIWSDEVQTGRGDVLAWLGKRGADDEFGVLTVFFAHEVIKRLLFEVDVTGAGFN